MVGEVVRWRHNSSTAPPKMGKAYTSEEPYCGMRASTRIYRESTRRTYSRIAANQSEIFSSKIQRPVANYNLPLFRSCGHFLSTLVTGITE